MVHRYYELYFFLYYEVYCQTKAKKLYTLWSSSPEAILSEDMDTVWNAMYSSQPVNFFFAFAVVSRNDYCIVYDVSSYLGAN